MSTYTGNPNNGITVASAIPDDGTKLKASDVNVPIEAILDSLAAILAGKVDPIIGPGRTLTIQNLATLLLAVGSTLNINGTANLANAAVLNLILGSTVNGNGTINLNSGGVLDAKSGSRVIAEAGSMLAILGRSRIRAPFRPVNANQTIDTTQGNHVLLAWNGGTIKTITLRQSTAPIPEEGEWMLLVSDNANTAGTNYHINREGGTLLVDLGDPGSWALVTIEGGVWRGLMYAGANVVPGPGW